MDVVRDLSHDLVSRDWQEYAEACCCHDRAEPVVHHARDLAHAEDRVLAVTAATSLGRQRVRPSGKPYIGTGWEQGSIPWSSTAPQLRDALRYVVLCRGVPAPIV